MILKRIGKAIRARDWAAVAIEFVVVVLGIFVALEVGEWNQRRIDRTLEQAYLSRLADEARANLQTMRQMDQIFAEKVRFVLALPELRLEEAILEDPQAFVGQLDDSSWVMLPDLRSESFEELRSSGRLALLRDAKLRGAIASLLNDYRSTRPVFEQPIGDYRRLLFEALSGRCYYDYRVGTGARDVASIAASVESLRNDPRFEAAANAEVIYGSDMLFYVREFTQRLEEVVAMLEAR
jgi:hypothetical protein